LDLWQSRGASAWYDVWWAALGELRTRYAAVIGAAPAEIALAPSISVAVSTVAEALEYAKRPKVVVTSLDFPTVAYQWLAKARRGIEVVVVESPDGVTVPLDALARAVDDRTALVATSHVYFTSGAIQDIRAVAELAHARGALCLVDAYQSVGQVPVDVRTAGVDFLTAGGLKWLLGGTGVVFLYVRAELARRLQPTTAGWFGHRQQFAFDPHALEFHDDARRFELGTPALAAIYAQLVHRGDRRSGHSRRDGGADRRPDRPRPGGGPRTQGRRGSRDALRDRHAPDVGPRGGGAPPG
jgi:selenocysteine lyase/cysteine desulfurase